MSSFQSAVIDSDAVSSTTHTFSSPNVAGADRMLLVCTTSTSGTVSTVTHNAQTMTRLFTKVSDTSIRIWGRIGPVTGVNDVVTTSSGAVTINQITIANYTGVDQITPTENFTDAFSTGPFDVSSAPGDLAVSYWTDNAIATLTLTGPAGGIIRIQDSMPRILATCDAPGAATVTFSWTVSGSVNSPRLIGLSLIAAAAGPGPSAISSYRRHFFRG